VADRIHQVAAATIAAAAGFITAACGGGSPSTEDKASGSSSSSAARTSTSKAPYPWEHMPGDGYHQLGGVDGKSWGVWRSTGSTQPCEWSIRVTDPNGPATILDEGTAGAGESVRVNIQPPGDVSGMTGKLPNGGRVVFVTHGCGEWTLED